MTVYIDMLLVINLIINYFIIKGVCLIDSYNAKTKRTVAAAAIGAAGSLIILFPDIGFILTAAIKIVIGSLMTLTAFGLESYKRFFKRTALVFAVTYIFGGIMQVLQTVFKTKSFCVNNQTVYFDISPLMLIFCTAICYIILKTVLYFVSRCKSGDIIYNVEITANGTTVSTQALLDTGNSLTDIYSGTPVVIIDETVADKLLTKQVVTTIKQCDFSSPLPSSFRLLPYSSIGEKGFLPAFKPDKVKITQGKSRSEITDITVAVGSVQCNGEYHALIGEDIIS